MHTVVDVLPSAAPAIVDACLGRRRAVARGRPLGWRPAREAGSSGTCISLLRRAFRAPARKLRVSREAGSRRLDRIVLCYVQPFGSLHVPLGHPYPAARVRLSGRQRAAGDNRSRPAGPAPSARRVRPLAA